MSKIRFKNGSILGINHSLFGTLEKFVDGRLLASTACPHWCAVVEARFHTCLEDEGTGVGVERPTDSPEYAKLACYPAAHAFSVQPPVQIAGEGHAQYTKRLHLSNRCPFDD